ncbi:MAG TPA: UDP-4-amino-4,6-dideoxy-N-acetyl-beta-L-altrosamine transaminase [Spirochaetia bacterium]|nr:UDP-4-amino-4,6-dideoxy-N-acetyl-beta-L-altrosamine transaminase [Spirochaetia bacterium]
MKRPDRFISFSPPLLGEEEISEVTDTLRSQWLTTGKKTAKFQEHFSAYCGSQKAVAMNSCTACLHTALALLELKAGDEVIAPSFTFASTGHTVLYTGARLVLCDILPDTLTMNPEHFASLITEHTRAVMPVHYAGHPCELDEIRSLAKKNNIIVIEDAAHAAGAEYRGVKIGNTGHAACFSFYATKNLTTAEGGMLTTNNIDFAEKAARLSMYGISDSREMAKRYSETGTWEYDIAELGFKYNMPDTAAAIGIHQLTRLDKFIERRKAHAAIYRSAFKNCRNISLPAERSYVKSAQHLFPVLFSRSVSRNRIYDELKKHGIGTSVHFKPLHMHTFYKNYFQKNISLPVCEDVFSRILCLPVSPVHTEDEINYIAETLTEIAG